MTLHKRVLLVFFALLLFAILAKTSIAASYNSIYSFPSIDGGTPYANLTLVGNALYGTTTLGGTYGYGTVFTVNTDGTGYNVIYSFTDTSDGAYPVAGLTLVGNTLYGTTSGSDAPYGTVFSINPDGTGFNVIYTFTGQPDGAYPGAGLTNVGNALYGTTNSGGEYNYGAVFAVNTDGTGYNVIYSFSGQPDGEYPDAGLTLVGNALYGTTQSGGADNHGVVFAINTLDYSYNVIYSFTGSPDGQNPDASLTQVGNALYGTTNEGGTDNYGAVFAINTLDYSYNVIYSFNAFSDGLQPDAALTLVGNTLYGTTTLGGTYGYGTVFTVNTDGTGYNVLYSFSGQPDGQNPNAALTLVGNTLYGTTLHGGEYGHGLIFTVNTVDYSYNVVYFFNAPPDGQNPYAALTLAGNALYGTTTLGGTYGYGTVFTVNTDSSGYNVIYSFNAPPDGQNPYAALTLAGNALYGTTYYGDVDGDGTVFTVNTDGTGYNVIYSFTGSPDGQYPYAALTHAGNALYGTTSYGGEFNGGAVFTVNTDGTGYNVIYSFSGQPDGLFPSAALTLAGNTLYGTTTLGGEYNNGAIFTINTIDYSYNVIYSFTDSPDGQNPDAALTHAGNTLYGTTLDGGEYNNGAIFTINTIDYSYNVIYSFTGSPDGQNPYAALTQVGNALYGTTSYGGEYNYGAVFAINTLDYSYNVIYSFTGSPDGQNPHAALTLVGNTLYGTTVNGGTSNIGTIFVITTGSTPTPPSTTSTTIPQGGGGGGGSSGGLPGSSGSSGGSSKPIVTNVTYTYKNTSNLNQTTLSVINGTKGYQVKNFAARDSETFDMPGNKTLTITVSSISPTKAVLIINGASYNLTPGVPISVDPPKYTYYVLLENISYVPIEQTLTIGVLSKPITTSSTVTTTSTTILPKTTLLSTIIPSTTTLPTAIIQTKQSAYSTLNFAIFAVVILVIIFTVYYIYLRSRKGKKGKSS